MQSLRKVTIQIQSNVSPSGTTEQLKQVTNNKISTYSFSFVSGTGGVGVVKVIRWETVDYLGTRLVTTLPAQAKVNCVLRTAKFRSVIREYRKYFRVFNEPPARENNTYRWYKQVKTQTLMDINVQEDSLLATTKPLVPATSKAT